MKGYRKNAVMTAWEHMITIEGPVKFVLSTPAKVGNSDKYTNLNMKDEKSGMKLAQLAESINAGFDFRRDVKPWMLEVRAG
ncbi:hypothetical protein SUGI_0006850 [Cryptomeria japonica]|nr:hypothetical protein SUGI_0006850 [Cryptomeria japonica]